MKYLSDIKNFESLVHKNSIDQLKRVSKDLKNIDIGKRVGDNSFANALSTKKNIVDDNNIMTYSDYMKEPFTVNQNRKPWKQRKSKKK